MKKAGFTDSVRLTKAKYVEGQLRKSFSSEWKSVIEKYKHIPIPGRGLRKYVPSMEILLSFEGNAEPSFEDDARKVY